jgi:hypothetical protein
MAFVLGFDFNCEVLWNASRAQLQTSKISSYETCYASRNNECQLLSCDALILTNNDNSTPQHCRTNSCGRMTKQGTTWSYIFLVLEATTLFMQLPTVLLLTTALP